MRRLGTVSALLIISTALYAQAYGSLKTVAVPTIPGLDRYVRDRDALVVLGKALFWDMQVGSDGRTACGTCHFHAGADHRARNQLSNAVGPFEPNHSLAPDDFPFRVFADPDDSRSAVVRDSGQRCGSAGIVYREFSGLTSSAVEEGHDGAETLGFQIDGVNIRQVTPRNAPTVINAVFQVRLFDDGRASDIFTGRTPFGDSDPRANVVALSNGRLVPEAVRLTHAALASQATAPPVNTVELSYHGRTWEILSRKLLPAHPLALQTVAPDDSVLAPYVDSCCRGLAPSHTYLTLVRAAFQPAYWDSNELVDGEFTAAEHNFPLFFALAVQAYESTLIADDSRFDRFMAGATDALTQQEKSGFLVFQTRAFCQFCHSGPELSNAGITFAASHAAFDSMSTGQPGAFQDLFVDAGFFRTGVRPASEDPGLGATDDFSAPLSLAARSGSAPLGVDGAFRIPGLRNVEFTGPYFHSGGQATLEQVVDFYARGADFPGSPGLPLEIAPVPLTATDRKDLVAFLKSLSDDRVRFERAPFDHPELCVSLGYEGTAERWAGIPAAGRTGNSVPLQTFEELLNDAGADGTRAHTLTDACRIP
jgi:cytochrome c peroxidase